MPGQHRRRPVFLMSVRDSGGAEMLEQFWLSRPEFFSRVARDGDVIDLFYYPPAYRGHILH